MLGWGQGAPAAPCISGGSAWLSRFPPWQTPLNNLPGSPNSHLWSLSALLYTTHPFPRQDGMWGAPGLPKPGVFLQFSSVLLCSKTRLGARQCQGMAARCTGIAKLIHPAQIYNPLVAALQALPPAPFWSPGGDTSLPSPDPTPVPICCRQPEGEAPRWCRAELVILRALMKFSHFPPIPSTTLLRGHLPLSPCPLVPLSWGLGPAGFLQLASRWLPCPV